MAKFYDKVGFAITQETDPINRPGIWEDTIKEEWYAGDFVYNITSRWVDTSQLNDDLKINNKISIVADDFAIEHWPAIKYLWYKGIKWKVTSVENALPRLVLTTGGEYNG